MANEVKMVPSRADWLTLAIGELGITEKPGAASNERIVQYHATTTLRATQDSVAWCSAYVNWVMRHAGYKGTNSAAARSWLGYGIESKPRVGAILVFERTDPGNKTAAHVGFMLGATSADYIVLGGNQGDSVSVVLKPKPTLIGTRWPDTLVAFSP